MIDNIFYNKKILIVASDFIYPPDHGGNVDIWYRLKCFYNLGFKIDLICTVKKKPALKNEKIVKHYINKLIILYRKKNIINLLSKKPFPMKVRENLKKIDLSYEYYDYVFMEGGTVTLILENKTLKYKHLILRVHNDDSVYYNQLMQSENILWKKLYYLIESYKYKYLYKYIFKRISNCMFISYNEMEKYRKKYINSNICFLPSAVELNLKKQSLDTRNVLIISSLFMVNNKEAIRFYIEKIHPLLCDISGYNLIIAGNSRGEGVNWIKKLTCQYNNIKIFDTPENLDELYSISSIFVNPMLHGAGVKLKTINAIVNGLPVVSTSVGNEGTGLKPGKEIYVSDDVEEYVNYIKILLNSRKKRMDLVNNAQQYIKVHYNQKNIIYDYFLALETKE